MAADGGPGYPANEVERGVLDFWEEHGTFGRTLVRREGAPPFRFLEGPPTANGLPHAGHVLTRTLKDSVLRYKTMRGHRVDRRAGWDCHGLPVEIEVEKELGLTNKQEVERYGVAEFNAKCRESVFRYLDEWVAMSRRVGFWLDFDAAYATLTNDYMESVWWSLKQAWEKGLLVKGHRVSPYCPRCGTALSSHEVAQGYRDVEEASVFVKFPVAGTPGEYLLAWTTTPWTLPGNVGLAVGQDIEYVTVEQETPDGTERYTLARACLDVLRGPWRHVASRSGADLEGIRYEPVFPWLAGSLASEERERGWRVSVADFVTTEDGTGIVHTAAMYGEEDYDLAQAVHYPMRHTVDTAGRFLPFVTPYADQFVKEADPRIIEDLRAAGRLYRVKPHTHSYPFCWRCATPLLYYAIDSWFLRMTALRDRLVAHNATVDWYPGHVKEGRFGEFVANVRDWALSRDRYWGTPLPVWTCQACGQRECLGSIKELRERGGQSVALAERDGQLDLHKPHIDHVVLSCTGCQGEMRREGSVIDTWYDSGAAHFAQWHHPFENADKIDDRTPVDFVAEGLDQTRGWFYSLLATAAIVFDRPAYRTVVVNGLVLDGKGQKMSKSKRNYTDPDEMFRTFGADAMRWSLLSSSALWADKRFTEAAVRESYSRFVLTLWNTFQFYATYRDLDGWTPGGKAPKRPPALDRWLRSRLADVVARAQVEADAYNFHKATRAIEAFLVDDLSNWWLRRSRRRFWVEQADEDKASAYHTLHEALSTLVRLAAPFAPFLPEHVHRAIRGQAEPESVHLADFPAPAQPRDEALEAAMQHVRTLAEGLRALRAKAGIKNRVPLPRTTVVHQGKVPDAFLELVPVLRSEANVKEVTFAKSSEAFEASEARINPRSIGRSLKAAAKPVLAALHGADARATAQALQRDGHLTVGTPGGPVEVAAEHFVFETVERQGTLKATSGPYACYLETALTEELEAEGWAREIVRRIQEMRKDAACQIMEKITARIDAPDDVRHHLEGWLDFIKEETRSRDVDFGHAKDDGVRDWDIDGVTVRIAIARSSA